MTINIKKYMEEGISEVFGFMDDFYKLFTMRVS